MQPIKNLKVETKKIIQFIQLQSIKVNYNGNFQNHTWKGQWNQWTMDQDFFLETAHCPEATSFHNY